MDIITPDSFLFHLLLDRIHVSRVSYNCSHFLPCPAYYWEREKTFALITGGRIRGSRACDFFFFLPRSGLLPFIPAAIRFMSDIAFTFCARCGRRTALLRTWPFGGQKNIIPSLHPSAFSFRRRRRGHSIPRSVHCRRHHATRWRPPRPRKKKVSLTPLLFALWLEEPPLGNEALFIFQTERSLLHEKWESRGKRGNLDPNQVEARKCTPV